MNKAIFGFFAIILTSYSAHAADVLKGNDDIRLSWREFSASKPGHYMVSILAKVCVGEEGAATVRCAPLGQFDAGTLNIVEAKPLDIKKNTDKISGTEINKLAATLTANMRNPLIRLSITLSQQVQNDKGVLTTSAIDEKFVAFPSLAQTADNERGVLQDKVILQGAGLRSRVLVEIYRKL